MSKAGTLKGSAPSSRRAVSSAAAVVEAACAAASGCGFGARSVLSARARAALPISLAPFTHHVASALSAGA